MSSIIPADSAKVRKGKGEAFSLQAPAIFARENIKSLNPDRLLHFGSWKDSNASKSVGYPAGSDAPL